MLRQVSASHRPFCLTRPFRISRGVKSVADTIVVEICEGIFCGRGEGVPYLRYAETLETGLAQIEAVRAELVNGADRFRLLDIMPPGAARNAVDCALWDLEAQLAGKSVAELAGLPEPKPTATAMTIGLDTPDAMAVVASKMANFPLLKIKVDALDPLSAVRAVRDAAPGPRVIVDPNESWSFANLKEWHEELAELDVDLLEQPLPAGADEDLKEFHSRVPLAADESGHVAEDISDLARRYQYVNIKLDKTGGLTTALAMVSAADRAGLGVMVGCMVSSSLSIAPALLIAQRSDFVDLDGPTWLEQDYPRGVTEAHGILTPAPQDFWGGYNATL